jgi:hypothetical protein
MTPSTKPNATPKALCPKCGREIGLKRNGQISRHQNQYGFQCFGRLRTISLPPEFGEKK